MASPMDLPRRLAASIGNSIDAAGELPVFQQKVLKHLASMDQVMSEHMSSMDENTAALLDVIRPMQRDIATLVEVIRPMQRDISSLDERIARLEGAVQTVAERTPDPDEPGTLSKAKDALTG
jgi:uncharacterized protein YoxC